MNRMYSIVTLFRFGDGVRFVNFHVDGPDLLKETAIRIFEEDCAEQLTTEIRESREVMEIILPENRNADQS